MSPQFTDILGIAKGVALRLRRICSKEEDFRAKSAEYANYLIECGHEKEHVLDKFREVGNISREDARKSKKKSNEGYCCLVTKYNPRGPDIRKIINKHHKSNICCDEKARDILPEKVIRVSFKRNANLKELLAPSNPYGKENTEVEQFGCFNCTAKRCDCCKNFLLEGHTCMQLDVSFIDNTTIDDTCLNGSKLHLNAKGSAILAVHFIKFLKGGSASTSPSKRRQNYEDFQRSAIQKLGELLKIIVPPDKGTRTRRRK